MITAVDVGGTKTLVAQFDAQGKPIGESRFETPPSPEKFLHVLKDQLDAYDSLESITIAVPGIINEDGVILRCANLPWKLFPLRHHLETHYKIPVFVHNDAKLAALGEVNRLTPIPRLGVYLTISTGIGMGMIADGKLLAGFKTLEAGHMRLSYEGKWQAWENFASGRALVEHFGKQAKDFTLASEWQEVADRLSRGLYCLIPTLCPDVILFGGGVGMHFEKFDDYLVEKLKVMEPYISLPRLRKAHHPYEAVLYGCYFYATHEQPA